MKKKKKKQKKKNRGKRRSRRREKIKITIGLVPNHFAPTTTPTGQSDELPLHQITSYAPRVHSYLFKTGHCLTINHDTVDIIVDFHSVEPSIFGLVKNVPTFLHYF